MKKLPALITLTALVVAASSTAFAASTGEELFKKHCIVCHPNGGNTINPKKTLSKRTLEMQGIKDWKGVVKTLRNPGPGMTKFDGKTLPDKEARQIAEFILIKYR